MAEKDKEKSGTAKTEFMVLRQQSIPGFDSGAWVEVGTIVGHNAKDAQQKMAEQLANSEDEKEQARATGTFKAVAFRSWKTEPSTFKPKITVEAV